MINKVMLAGSGVFTQLVATQLVACCMLSFGVRQRGQECAIREPAYKCVMSEAASLNFTKKLRFTDSHLTETCKCIQVTKTVCKAA